MYALVVPLPTSSVDISNKVHFYLANFMTSVFFFRYLTNEGIEYLRTFLHLPPEIVPATLKRSVRIETVRRGAGGRPDAPARTAEDRSNYRRAPTAPGDGHDKKADVGPGSAGVEFVSNVFTSNAIRFYLEANSLLK